VVVSVVAVSASVKMRQSSQDVLSVLLVASRKQLTQIGVGLAAQRNLLHPLRLANVLA
jgi:hypothetical protein